MREFASKFRPYFIYAAAFSLVINLLMLVPAIFMLQVFDRVVTSRSAETLIMLLIVTLLALFFMAYLDIIRARLLTAAGVLLEKLLGPRVLQDMLRRSASPSAARDQLFGLRDVGSLRTFLTGPGILALFDAPWVPVFLLIIFLFHPLLGWVAALGALLLFGLAYLNEKLSRQPLEKMQAESRKAGRFVDQSMGNAEVARALGMAENLTNEWKELSHNVLKLQVEASRASSLLTSLTRSTRQFLQVAMLATGAWLVVTQEATAGVMIAATILLGRALAPVESAIAGWKALVDARSAYGRLDKALADTPDEESKTQLPAPRGALSVENVTFGFRGQERPVIRGANFQLAPGEALAIIGPSAAGKSTLARLIVGVWKPFGGAVRLDGADIASWPRTRLGPHVGYLPQTVEIFAGTVSNNIARMGEIESEAVIEAATRANVHEMILNLAQGYDTHVGEGGAFLSAGQRQRVALARALYGDPRLVVLDEPNANLDNEGENALVRTIRQLKKEGVTVIVISHRAPLLGAVDKVLVLIDGKVEKFGPPAEVLAPLRARGHEPPHAVAGQVAPKG